MTEMTTSTAQTMNYKQMAIELLNKKDEPRFYIVSFEDGDSDMPHSYYMKITKEQLVEIKGILDECKKEDIALWEYFDGKNVPEYIAAVEPYLCEAPSEIETETAYVDCKIKMAIFYDGLKEAPEVIDSCIFLSEEQYVNLLEWQLDNRHSNYNDLASKNFELFKVVNDKARARFNYGGIPYDNTPTFTIELTSIQEDAYALFGEPSICADIFESYTDQIAEHSYLSIENRVLSFFYEAMNDDKWIEYTEVNKIDAIAVEKAFEVDSYRGIAKVLKQKFNGREGFYHFIEFLDEHNIAYTKETR